MKSVKYAAINIIVIAILYVAVCLPFYLMSDAEVVTNGQKYDENTYRSTFPNYKNMDPDKAFKIFASYIAPKSKYKAFVGYRRAPYKSEFVNIDTNGYRLSLNHSLEPDYVFLGGSTTWGTGVADDETIPSHFAKLTGATVLNLGESGFNSIQELNQLFYYLNSAKKKPKTVFLYDGVNDGYDFCQGENVPTHSFESRFIEMIDAYPRLLELSGKNAMSSVGAMPISRFLTLKLINSSTFAYLKSPFTYAARISAEKSNPYSDKSLSTSTKFDQVVAKNSILNCDIDSRARKAAAITVRAWLAAFSELKKEGIEAVFILQPASQTHDPSRLQLDHLLDAHKQLIRDTTPSYKNFYKHLLAHWKKQCSGHGACSHLLDASTVLNDLDGPVFIDDCHISGNGNQQVAQSLLAFLKRKSNR